MAGRSAKFEVLLTEGAEQDLESIHDYISEFDCVANANHVLDELMDVVESLSKFPERGSYPKELIGLGIKEYRQTYQNGSWEPSDSYAWAPGLWVDYQPASASSRIRCTWCFNFAHTSGHILIAQREDL